MDGFPKFAEARQSVHHRRPQESRSIWYRQQNCPSRRTTKENAPRGPAVIVG
jgi:hypothetical protein